MFLKLVVLISVLGSSMVSANLPSVYSSKRMQMLKDTVKKAFSTEVTSESDFGNLRPSSAMNVESTSMKYLNMFASSDDYCTDIIFEGFIPLNTCLPNQFEATSGHFAMYKCDTSASTCIIKGFTDSMCTMKASGTHRVTAALPTGCSLDSGYFTGVYYNFSHTMPYHTSGSMSKMYATSTCTGPHATFYSPDGSCSVNGDGTGSGAIYCSSDTVYRYESSDDCTGDYYTEPIADYKEGYDTCYPFTTPVGDDDTVGGSTLEICGGITTV